MWPVLSPQSVIHEVKVATWRPRPAFSVGQDGVPLSEEGVLAVGAAAAVVAAARRRARVVGVKYILVVVMGLGGLELELRTWGSMNTKEDAGE